MYIDSDIADTLAIVCITLMPAILYAYFSKVFECRRLRSEVENLKTQTECKEHRRDKNDAD